jgi:hypothetical protein
VAKAFNSIYFTHLATLARPAGAADRSALAIAGEDNTAKATVGALLDQIRYDNVDLGPPVLGPESRAGAPLRRRGRPVGRQPLERAPRPRSDCMLATRAPSQVVPSIPSLSSGTGWLDGRRNPRPPHAGGPVISSRSLTGIPSDLLIGVRFEGNPVSGNPCPGVNPAGGGLYGIGSGACWLVTRDAVPMIRRHAETSGTSGFRDFPEQISRSDDSEMPECGSLPDMPQSKRWHAENHETGA